MSISRSETQTGEQQFFRANQILSGNHTFAASFIALAVRLSGELNASKVRIHIRLHWNLNSSDPSDLISIPERNPCHKVQCILYPSNIKLVWRTNGHHFRSKQSDMLSCWIKLALMLCIILKRSRYANFKRPSYLSALDWSQFHINRADPCQEINHRPLGRRVSSRVRTIQHYVGCRRWIWFKTKLLPPCDRKVPLLSIRPQADWWSAVPRNCHTDI